MEYQTFCRNVEVSGSKPSNDPLYCTDITGKTYTLF